MRGISEYVTEDHLIISIAAGYNIDKIAKNLGSENRRIVRTVPNTPVQVGEGYSTYSFNEVTSQNPEDVKTVKTLMSSVGLAYEVTENICDSVLGLSGSGPSFVFMFIEALADGGVK